MRSTLRLVFQFKSVAKIDTGGLVHHRMLLLLEARRVEYTTIGCCTSYFNLSHRRKDEIMNDAMQVVHERCCGLDVHKKSVTACIITPDGKEVRNFGTMTADLLELMDWIISKSCSGVAMESTGKEAKGREAFTIVKVN